ncbi:hypothetical protein AB9P05_09455 [Roseivirga sp. BDSF3-8]|uniref:hypothetical protein n=1 Tax=Roseivirga sp. BDSF3-8 TaxID=3241598 RepID=UPI0035319787
MQERPRIKLFEERDFGQKFSAAFSFIGREAKPLLHVLARFVGVPLLLLALLGGLNTAFQLEVIASYPNDYGMGPMIFVIYFLSLVVFTIMVCVVAGYMKVYSSLSEPGEKVSGKAVWHVIKGKLIPVFFLNIVYFLIVIVGFIFLILPGIYLAVAMSLCHVIYIMEDTDIFSSLGRSVKLVNQEFFPSLGFIFIMALLAGIIGSVIQVPVYILTAFVGMSSAIGESGIDVPIWVTTLIVAIPTALAYLSYVLVYLGNLFLYGSLREASEAPGIMDAVNNFGKREEDNNENIVSY